MNRVIFSSIISLLLIAALAIGYFYYDGYTENKTYPESALPPDAAFFIKGSLKNLMNDVGMLPFWKNADSISFVHVLKEEMNMLAEFFATEAVNSNISENNDGIISFQFTGVDKVDALFIFPVKKNLNIKALADVVKGKSTDIMESPTREFAGVNIYELNFQSEKKQFTYAFSSGIFIGSFTSYLVEDAIRQQSSGKIFGGDKEFTAQYKQKAGNADYVLCVHYPKFKNFLSAFISLEKIYKLDRVANWAEWSMQHILISKEKIVADGFIINRDTGFISSTFSKCEAVQITISEILPASTKAFQTFAFDNCRQWLNNYQHKTDDNANVKLAKNLLNAFEQKVKVPVGEKLADLLSTEITVAILGTTTAKYEGNVLAFVKLKNSEKAAITLRALSALAADEKNKKNQFEEFKSHKIGLLPVDGLMPAVFGNSFSLLQKGYYTIHNNYLVVANKVSTLRTCVEEIANDELLVKNKNFVSVSDYTKNKCNYLLYADVAASLSVWHEMANPKNLLITGEKHEYFKSFNSFLYLAANNPQNQFTCRTVLAFGKSAKSEGVFVDWSFITDTAIACGPFAIASDKKSSRYVLFQDSAANLLCVNETGTLLWQQPLDGFIKGKVNAVNYIDSGSVQFLFATDKKIYLLNEDGTTLGNYPIKLPAQTVSGVFADSKSQNYFVPCGNNRIYAYELSGRPAKGWDYTSTDASISTPVYFINVADKSTIYFADELHGLYVYDADGKRLLKSFLRQPAAGNSLSARSDSILHIFVSDTTGTLYTYRLDNAPSIRSTDYTGNVLHYTNKNIMDDNSPEHIFVHKHDVSVLKNDFSTAFKFDFKEELTPSLEILKSEGKNYILVSTVANSIFMINEKGKKVNGFPVKGNEYTLCVADSKIFLLVKEDAHTIKAYKVEN